MGSYAVQMVLKHYLVFSSLQDLFTNTGIRFPKMQILIQRIRREMRMRGVYSKPTPRDVWYVSAAHTDQDIDITLEIAEEAVKAVQK